MEPVFLVAAALSVAVSVAQRIPWSAPAAHPREENSVKTRKRENVRTDCPSSKPGKLHSQPISVPPCRTYGAQKRTREQNSVRTRECSPTLYFLQARTTSQQKVDRFRGSVPYVPCPEASRVVARCRDKDVSQRMPVQAPHRVLVRAVQPRNLRVHVGRLGVLLLVSRLASVMGRSESTSAHNDRVRTSAYGGTVGPSARKTTEFDQQSVWIYS